MRRFRKNSAQHFFGIVTLLALLPVSAQAMTPGLYLTPAEALPPAELAIARQPADAAVTISADEMAADEKHSIVIARGHVEVMQGESIITADQLTYYQQSDLVVAQGNVSMLQPNGDVYFSEKAELKDAMKRAVIHDFKARFADISVLVAHKATKVNSNVTALDHASYTPCNLCETMAPFWQMNAQSAVVDDSDERVTYRGAFMEMSGIPVFYTPYLSHPTPNATGKSGLLTPSYSNNPYFGTVAKVPYYWRIAQDKDVVVTPWVMTNETPLLQWEYQQLRNAGAYHMQGSITDPKKRNDAGDVINGHELRGHIFATGDEKISEDGHIGFEIARTTDDTYLRRYGFGDQQALFSRAYYEQAQGRNFALAQGLSIQGLRSTDNANTTPLMLPILQGYYETPAHKDGITYHLAADAQILSRKRGVDQRRMIITPGATLPIVSEGGQIFTAHLNVRQDIYNADHVPISGSPDFSGTTLRTLPQAALEWRYPLIRTFDRGAWIVEPTVLGVTQPDGGNPKEISNEDATLLELSDTNLFSLDRMPGLDLVDSGSRIAYGMRSHYYDRSGINFSGFLGQNYSFNGDTPFPNSTRSGEQFSDYIGRVAANYQPFSLAYRFAVDKENATLNRNEIDFGFSRPWLSLASSYRTLRNNRYLNDSREAVLNGTLPLSETWSIYGGARRDFEIDQMVMANGGIIYKNECFNIMLDGLRVYARDRDIAPTTEYTFRVAFKNLGEFGGK